MTEKSTKPPPIKPTQKVEWERWHRSQNDSSSAPYGRQGNLNRRSHGIYVNRCLNEEEERVFRDVSARLQNDFAFNQSSDLILTELTAIHYLKMGRALKTDDYKAVEHFNRLILGNLRDLKATRLVRDKERAERVGTPAEWAAALLGRAAFQSNQ